MENPFQAGASVMTKVKGKEVSATVVKTWKTEVQVKTADNELLWRTMYTVWAAGQPPMARPIKQKPAQKASANQPTPKPKRPRAKSAKRPSRKRT